MLIYIYIVFADRSGQIRFFCWILNFMRYGVWEMYRIRSSWEILQLLLQQSKFFSVSAGSQHPISIFIHPLSAASITLTDIGGGLNKQKVFFQSNVCCWNIGPLCSVCMAITRSEWNSNYIFTDFLCSNTAKYRFHS